MNWPRSLIHRVAPRPMPLGLILVVPFVLQTVVVVGLTGYLSFLQGQRTLHRVASEFSSEITPHLRQQLEDYLALPHQVNQLSAKALEKGDLSGNNGTRYTAYLTEQLQFFQSLADTRLATEGGALYGVQRLTPTQLQLMIADASTNNQIHYYGLDAAGKRQNLVKATSKPYQPQSQPWYKAALEAKTATWAPIGFSEFLPDTLVITAVQPVYDRNQERLGVLSSSLDLNQINQFLHEFKISKSGQSFILEPSTGYLIGSSNLDSLVQRGAQLAAPMVASQSENPLIQQTSQTLIQQFQGLSEIKTVQPLEMEINGIKHFGAVTRVSQGGLEWLMVVMVPETDFSDQIRSNTITTILFCFAALGLAITGGVFTSRWIARSIQRLQAAAQAIANGQLDQHLDMVGVQELDELAQSFNQMGQQLQIAFTAWEQTNEELEEQVQQRTFELSQSEAKFAKAFRSSPDPIAISTFTTGQFIDVNDSFLECFGYSLNELIGRSAQELNLWVNLADRERLTEMLTEKGLVRNHEIEMRLRSGEIRTFLVSSDRVELAGQACLLSVLNDITERKRAEEAVHLLLTITQAVNEAPDFPTALGVALEQLCEATGWNYGEAWIPSADGSALECSPTWYGNSVGLDASAITSLQEFRHYSEGLVLLPGEELPGRVWSSGQPEWVVDISAESNDVFLRANIAKACGLKAGFGVPIAITTDRSTPQVLAILVFLMAEPRHQAQRLVQLVSVVAAQLGTVIQQKQASAELRALFAAMTDTIVVLDAQGCYLKIAPTKSHQFYQPKPELIGQTLHDVFAKTQADWFLKQVWECLNTQEAVQGEYSLPLDHHTVWFASTFSPISEDRVIWICRDITEQKEAELALQEAKEAADAANAAKSEFLASMSHELRTPMNAILGFTQLMQRENSLNAEQRENLQIISRSGEHLLGLINDVLDMSKIEAGRVTLNENSFNLYRLLDDLEQLFYLKAQSQDLQLKFECSPKIPLAITTDEGKLKQVLINLLGNAIKFTKAGSVTLRVKAKESTALSPDTIILQFEVEDTGAGIASDEIHLLFDPFMQTESGRKSHEGTGLGLPISRKFVQLMGGDITIESVLNQGSIFKFEIYATVADPATVPSVITPPKVSQLVAGQPIYRILVVDDYWENRLLLLKLLQTLGFEVQEAETGEDAVRLWETWHPHLIFMDIRMPGMDGYEATRQIRCREQEPTFTGTKTVIIALTASIVQEEQALILGAGCDDLIRKPFAESFLLAKIAETLGVRYLYESQPSISPTFSSSASLDLEALKTQIRQMPADWITGLHLAALQGRDQRIVNLITEIPETQTTLVKILTTWNNNFEFDHIIDLTLTVQS